MEKNPAHLQEILFGSSDKKESRQISLYVKNGTAKKIAPRLYTTNMADSPGSIIKRNWFRILAEQYPGAILSHRSALESRPTPDGHIFLTYTYTKNIPLPGLTIHFQKGVGRIEGDPGFFGELYMSQEARAYLENLQTSRGAEPPKTLTREQIEQRLETLIRSRGEEGLNELRDRARSIADELDMQKEFIKLNTLISALLATKPSKLLSSTVAKARALGEPFDPSRIALFEKLYEALAGQDFPFYYDKNESTRSYQNFAFFESYFSNYIEGTMFEVEEAKQIILTETPLPARNEDSHDVLGTYKLVSNRQEMAVCPASADELLHLVRYRHKLMLASRPNKNPGKFKDKNNRAGNTEFVDQTLVAGTLKKGFDWYSMLRHPFAKSAYMMFLISEVHPFLDGNGRVARVMMNAELSSNSLSKIIVPTVYREDYMGALRLLTRRGETAPFIRMMLRLYAFSSTVYGEASNAMEVYLRSCDAFMEPQEGKLKFQLPGRN
ncbi:Fic family protein [Mucilaginibacter ginsenosidivorans]|uniref:Cell filamentation protein Fic n=1 Tax=Mucilaginibacter ginsenosidivorans TaxID=398053 RepID=A0A5B8UTQ6_9SPHI|nr:Fic family protein [Mucilaginibacter ginsenosidivorans]QEC62487.1 cell filamentation protein Fic [Mucilaginibacter ginsenosidivorans]